MFLGLAVNVLLYEALISVVLIGVWMAVFKRVRFTVKERVEHLAAFLKEIEKSIRSGSVGISKINCSKDSSQIAQDSEREIKLAIIQNIDKGIRASVEEVSKVVFLKESLKKYQSFLKEKFYFYAIFKNKILLLLLVAGLVRWVAVFFDAKFEKYLGVDLVLVVGDIILLVYLIFAFTKKVNLSFIDKKSQIFQTWIKMYFYEGFSISKRSFQEPTAKNPFLEEVLKLYNKQIKDGVSYTEDIKGYLEAWILSQIEQEEEEFKKKVELFPLIELLLIGGSLLFLLVVPLCSII